MTPYILMWGLAFSLFFVCKWACLLTLPQASRAELAGHGLYFLFGYPGMDPREFLKRAERKPTTQEWALALLKMLGGIGLLWGLTRQIYPAHPAVAAWIGMIGVVLVLHFGSFHLLALAWQRAGFGVQPIMRSPLMANSLADFWSARWNLAFHFLASRFIYRPMKQRFGCRAALLGTFLASGLVHDLVITVPARSGYGLPTLYFLIQGVGILASQGRAARILGLRKRPAARAFAWCVTLLPAGFLFPQGFISNVILPFFRDIGAL